VQPAVIAGTSIGAVIGALYAAGVSGDRLSQLVKDIGFRDLYKIVLDFSILSQSAIFTDKGVEDFLSREIPARTFEELQIPLKVVATTFGTAARWYLKAATSSPPSGPPWPCRQFSNRYSSMTRS
jgi:NTE family protein